MNTDALARLYDRLTPRERLPLIMAAEERGDDAEADRLSRSAPKIHVRLPDYHGLGEGLFLLSLFHMIGQLHRGLSFWLGAGLGGLGDESRAFKFKRYKGEASRIWELARVVAYRMVVEADAWRRLCGELRIGPEVLLKDLPGYEEMQRTEEAARLAACTAEEATPSCGGPGIKRPRRSPRRRRPKPCGTSSTSASPGGDRRTVFMPCPGGGLRQCDSTND
jgi:hypothetical protein